MQSQAKREDPYNNKSTASLNINCSPNKLPKSREWVSVFVPGVSKSHEQTENKIY